MHDAYLVLARRSPIGKHGGVLATLRPDDLAALVMRDVVEASGVNPADIEDVIWGCANQAGEDNRNVARMAALLAGLPVSVPGTTINRLCGSGLDAVAQAARMVKVGEAQLVLAGGVESMSRAPWVLPKAERAFAVGSVTAYDTTLGWRFINPRLEEAFGSEAMGETAENLAEEYQIARANQDAFALESHRKAIAAQDSGRFASEIVSIELRQRKQRLRVSQDEGPRRDSDAASLAALRPAFRTGGTVTAGNASSLNDGAAAILVASHSYCQAHGLKPLAKVRSSAVAGVPPRIMGIGPVPSSRKALQLANLGLEDMGVIELNEAFAAQALAVLQEWQLDPSDPRLNPNGGAIALGHPLGCSGARILTTLLHEMQRRDDAEFGLATMCIGVGQGIAMVVEKVSS